MKRFCAIIIIGICFFLSGCGFHLRSASSFPSELHHLYFFDSKLYSPLSIELNTLFQSMKVQLAKKKSDAPFSIIISQDHFAFSRPDIVNLSLPTNINFIQSANVSIQNNKNKKIIANHYFETARSLTLNASQIYTTSPNSEIQKQLNHELSTLIYYWLVSNYIKDALTNAAHPKTT